MPDSSDRLKLGLSLLAVYIIWGTTYLGIRFGLEGFPPFILNGIRFLVAGSILVVIGRMRRQPWPTRSQWVNLMKTGAMLMVGGVGLVAMAEDYGVGSGVAATAVAIIPVWAALITGMLGEWPSRREWVGLVLGFAGVMVLVGEGDFRSTVTGTALIIVSPMFWSLGSVWSSRIELPAGAAMATAGQLLAGGVALTVIGPLRGERIVGTPSRSSWIALAYLIVFGSIIAYTAYVYLLKNVRASVATSYAYVNPIVAVIAGVTLGKEILTGPVFIAMPLILGGVALVTMGRRRVILPEPVPAPAIADEAL